jgi:hypothetical protein
LVLAGCGRGADDPRAKLFPASRELAINEQRRPSTVITVLYWPQMSGCVPCELPALRALAQAAAEQPDVQLVLVLPEQAINPAEKLGVPWPGSVVRLKTADYKKQIVVNPLPRVEVWDSAGQLLLLKTIPPNLVQAERVGDEVRWTKASARKGPSR